MWFLKRFLVSLAYDAIYQKIVTIGCGRVAFLWAIRLLKLPKLENE